MLDYPTKNPQENLAPISKRARQRETVIIPIVWTDAVDRFKAYLGEREKSPKTIKTYESELLQFMGWHVAAHDEQPVLATLDAQDLREWKLSLQNQEHAKTTINKKLATMGSFLRWAQREGFCLWIERPISERPKKPRPRWLDRKQEWKYLKAVKQKGNKRDLAIVQLMVGCGLRISEVAALDWTDITLTARKGEITVHGKGRKEREVYPDAEVREALKELAAWDNHPKEGPVFQGQRGALGPNGIWRILKQYQRPAGVELTPHQFRHTCGKRLDKAGKTIQEIGAILGHENLNTTRIYVEPGREELRAAMDRGAPKRQSQSDEEE